MKPELTKNQIEILEHTKRNRRYCGREPDVTKLQELGLLQSCGFVSWCPDEYFAITNEGISAIRRKAESREG